MHPVSFTNTHDDVTDLVNYGMGRPFIINYSINIKAAIKNEM